MMPLGKDKGKMDVDGEEVAFLWLDGKLNEIVAYNEFDALTTYLVWLRVVTSKVVQHVYCLRGRLFC